MLQAVDKSSTHNINDLVERCESVFRDERQAWASFNTEKGPESIEKVVLSEVAEKGAQEADASMV